MIMVELLRSNDLVLMSRITSYNVCYTKLLRVIVEHDPDVIAIADHVIEMGPKAGAQGGKVVYEGDLPGLLRSGTLTGTFLNHRPAFKQILRNPAGWLPIRNANLHNLKNVSVDIPIGVMTVITGVAGSGKSIV